MDAPGRSWENSTTFNRPSPNKNQDATIAAPSEPLIDQAFIRALTFAVGVCAKTGSHVSDLENNDALEVLKSIGRMMHFRGEEYASWLEARVRGFASDHPFFYQEFSADQLRWTFSPIIFDNEHRQPPMGNPSRLRATSASFFPPGRIQAEQPTADKRVCVSPPTENQVWNRSRGVFSLSPPFPQYSCAKDGATYLGSTTPHGILKTRFATPPGFKGVLPRSPPRSREKNLTTHINTQPTPPNRGRSNFEPSRELAGVSHIPSEERLLRAQAAGMTRNPLYLGDLTDLDISNATCPPEQNCAVRIENISRWAKNSEIFDLIVEGKVFSFSKKNPIPGRFQNCAARLVFTNRDAAEAFVSRGQSEKGIVLHGHRFAVKWNRDPCRPVRANERHQSRIIKVIGPQKELCAEGLEAVFHTHIKFELVESKEWLVEGDRKVVELSFCSVLGQSRVAYKFFHEYMDAWNLHGRFSIGFGLDPCEPIVGVPPMIDESSMTEHRDVGQAHI